MPPRFLPGRHMGLMELIQSLKNLGLNEKEARVYIALLQTGQSTAYRVAKHSGLKKPTAYVILDDLIDKGIVSKVPRAKIMQYNAISPEDLFSTYKSRLANAETEALPELKALSRGRMKNKVKVSYYEGLEGIREMYNKLCKTMAGKEYTGFFAHEKDTPPELLKFFDELNEKIRKQNIRRRGITVKHKSLKKYLNKDFQKKYQLNLRALPANVYDSNISIEIYKNYTQIFSHRYLQGILIDNPDIARTIKQIFEIVWKNDAVREADV